MPPCRTIESEKLSSSAKKTLVVARWLLQLEANDFGTALALRLIH